MNCLMNESENNRFQDFFTDHQYLDLKNYLYNYLLRRRAVRILLRQERPELILEIGSGISPLTVERPNVVYSELSFDAVNYLKRTLKSGHCVVADGKHLPFKTNTYSHIICSEVLEHMEDDRPAIEEIHRTLKKPHGSVIITVPHRRWYFGYDDRFVNHYRRYELLEIKEKLQSAGLKPDFIQKVLGPLEKITMIPVVYLFSFIEKHRRGEKTESGARKHWWMKLAAIIFKLLNIVYAGFAWLDARIMPRFLATVILIKSSATDKKA